MKKFGSFILVCLIAIVSCSRKEPVNFGNLEKLQGNWVMEGGENPDSNFLMESWSKVNDTLLTAISYEVVDGDSNLAETIRLVIREDKIYYIPSVTDQNNGQPIPFLMIANGNNRFVFESKEHDFPNLIVYELVSDSVLNASVSGKIKGEPRSMEFYYKRR